MLGRLRKITTEQALGSKCRLRLIVLVWLSNESLFKCLCITTEKRLWWGRLAEHAKDVVPLTWLVIGLWRLIFAIKRVLGQLEDQGSEALIQFAAFLVGRLLIMMDLVELVDGLEAQALVELVRLAWSSDGFALGWVDIFVLLLLFWILSIH